MKARKLDDDWESVSLATNAKFMEIIERSRASARARGTVPLVKVRGTKRPQAGRSRRRKPR